MCKQSKHRIGSVTKMEVAVVEGVIDLVGCRWCGGGGRGGGKSFSLGQGMYAQLSSSSLIICLCRHRHTTVFLITPWK